MALECRRLTPEWSNALADFFQSLGPEDTKHFHPHPLTAEEADRRCHHAGMDLYYILLDENRVLGYGMLRGWDQGYDVPSLGIAIHPAARGQGLTKVFMHFLHAAARARGATRVRLRVRPDNVKAVRLYRSLGYQIGGEDRGQLVGVLDLEGSS